MKQVIQTNEAPAAIGPYSQAISMGNFLFCSGQIAIDPKNNEVLKGDATLQTKQVMANIGAVLKAAGLGYQNVVKTTIFLADMVSSPASIHAKAEWFRC